MVKLEPVKTWCRGEEGPGPMQPQHCGGPNFLRSLQFPPVCEGGLRGGGEHAPSPLRPGGAAPAVRATRRRPGNWSMSGEGGME